MQTRTFEQWLDAVDAAIDAQIGLTSMDLPDVAYRDWYDDGLPPSRAAAKAIKYAQED